MPPSFTKSIFVLLLLLGCRGLAFAQSGNSLWFDGTNDRVDVPDGPQLDFGTGDFTVECWVSKKQNTTGWDNSYAVSKWNSGAHPGTNEWTLGLSETGNDNKPGFAIESSSTIYSVFAATPLILHQWTHLAGVREGTSLKLYVNGVLVGTTAIPAGVSVNNAGRILRMAANDICCGNSFQPFSRIMLDEVRIWNAARTQTQIQDNMNWVLSGIETGLVAYYNFNQGNPCCTNTGLTTLNNLTANALDGTLVNFSLNASSNPCVSNFTDAAASASCKIDELEYFFNTDPGLGMGESITLAPAQSQNPTLNVNLNAVPLGFNWIYLRARLDNGRWGMAEGRMFYKFDAGSTANPDPEDITHAEYFFDTDPGLGAATQVPIATPGTTVSQAVSVDLSGVSNGFHWIYFRSKFASGRWGMAEGRMFYKFDPTTAGNPAPVNITHAEYFFDTDPGLGAGNALAFTNADLSVSQAFSLDLSGVPDGFHWVYVRAKNADGKWGMAEGRMFYKFDPTTAGNPAPVNITHAEYFFDTDPGLGGGNALAFTNADLSVSQAFSLDLSGVSDGFHWIYVRAKNADGKWGMAEGRMFYKFDPTTTGNPAPVNITHAEYFFDTDPGLGMGSAIDLPDGQTVNTTVPVPTTGLSAGFHTLYIRSKFQNGTWGMAEGRTFYIGPNIGNPNIVAAEAFFNTDPGVGNGIAVPVPLPGRPLTINVATLVPQLAAGTHRFYLRAKDANGKWSITDRRSIIVPNHNGAVANIHHTTGGCGISNNETVFVDLQNLGTVGIPAGQATIQLVVTGANTGTYTVTYNVAVAAGSTAEVAFAGVNLSTPGTNNLTATLTLFNDNTSANNTTTGSIVGQTPSVFYTDADGDGFGDLNAPINSCTGAPSGTVSNYTDCDDADADIYPGAPELCNGLDDNCDGNIDDGLVAPVVSITPPNPGACEGSNSSVTLTASASGSPGSASATFVWSTGATTASISVNPSSTTTYTATATDPVNLCTGQTATTVSVFSLPTTSISTGGGTSFCIGEQVQLTATGAGGSGSGYTFEWENGSTANPRTVTVANATQTFSVTLADANGCTATADITLTGTPGAAVSVGFSPAEICAGSSSTVAAAVAGGTAPYLYAWSSGAGNVASFSASPSTTTSYTVTVTDAEGCVSTASGALTVNNIPGADAGDNDAVCAGSAYTLDGSAAGGTPPYIFAWSWPPNGSTTGANPSVTPLNSTTYTLLVTDVKGCTGEDQVTIAVNSVPNPNLPASVEICSGQSATLNASGGGTYAWSTGATTSGITVTMAGTYTVTVTSTAGCSAVASSIISVNPAPTADAGSDQLVCGSQQVTLTAGASGGTPGYTFSWPGYGNGNPLIVTPTTTTTYTLVVTDSEGCTATDQVTVNVLLNLDLTVTPNPAHVCADDSVALTAATTGGIPPYFYVWEDQAGNPLGTGSSVTVPSSVTTVHVSVTDASDTNCMSAESVPVILHTAPNPGLPPTTGVCAGGSVALVAAPGFGSYLWSTGATTQAITVSPATNTTYSVTVVDAFGCEGSDVVQVIVSPAVSVSANADPATICGGATATLTASATGGTAPISYVWSTGATGNTANANPTFTTTYTVTATDSFGCTATDTATVNVSGNVDISGTVNPSNGCPGDGRMLGIAVGAGQAPFTYAWSNGAGNVASQTVFPTTTTTYTATVTDATGCSDVATFFVPVLDAATVGISPDISLCAGADTILIASGGDTYLWSTGETNDTITVSESGTFTVTVTNAAGCTASASTEVSSAGAAPTLAFAGTVSGWDYSNVLALPKAASPYDQVFYKVKYTDPDGDLPAPGWPRLFLDFENNGSLTDTADRAYVMTRLFKDDANAEDGIIYYFDALGLNPSDNWFSSIRAIDEAGCVSAFIGFEGPDIRDRLDVHLFANDIMFSNTAPNPGDAVTVTVKIHNDSDEDAEDFVVHLKNEWSDETWLQTVPLAPAHAETLISFDITLPTAVSWCPIEIRLDHTDVLAEFNELNNFAVRPLNVGGYVLPGSIQAIAEAQPNPVIIVDPADPPKVAIAGTMWYSGNAVPLDDSSAAGVAITLRVLETGAEFQFFSQSDGTFRVEFPAPVTPGIYHFHADFTDYTLEGAFDGTFEVQNEPQAEVDLSVSLNFTASDYISLVYDPRSQSYLLTAVENQTTMNAGFTVTNGGTGNALQNTALTVHVPNANIEYLTFTVPPLNSGESWTSPTTALTFAHYGGSAVAAYCDAALQYFEGEKGEENNQSVPRMNIRILKAQPDMNPTPFTPLDLGNQAPTVYDCQQPFDWSFKVYNHGGAATGIPFDVELEIRDTGGTVVFTQTQEHAALALLAQGAVTFTGIDLADLGDYDMTVRIDVPFITLGQVIEWKENNNTWAGTMHVVECRPDFAPTIFRQSVEPLNPQHPGDAHFDVRMLNSGVLNFTDSIPVRWRVTTPGGGTTDYFTTLPNGLDQNEDTTLLDLLIATPPHGDNRLSVTVDYGGGIPELSEENNSDEIRLCWDFMPVIFPANDPVIASVPRQTVFQAKVNQLFNLGAYKASAIGVRFEIAGPGISGWHLLGDTIANNLDGYAVLNDVFAPSVYGLNEEGTYTLRVTVDSDGDYTECDEANNVLEKQIVVFDNPDYFVSSAMLNPDNLNPEPGEPISVYLSYTNIGMPNIGDTMTVSLKVDNDIVADQPGIGLNTGDNASVLFADAWSSNIVGMHILRGIVDRWNSVEEFSETNNQATRAIFVGQYPNLHFTEVSASANNPDLGEVIALNFEIQNQGDTGCYAQVVLRYNGTLPIGTVDIFVPANSTVAFDSAALWAVADPNTTIKFEITNASPAEYNPNDNEAFLPLNQISADVQTTPASCFLHADGTASIAASGADFFTFTWSDAAHNGASSANTLWTGNYTVTIADANDPARFTVLNFNVGAVPDVTAPTFVNTRDTAIYVFDGVCPATWDYPASWLPALDDGCDPDPELTVSPPSGTAFAPGVHDILFTATDSAGNVRTQIVHLTVYGVPTTFAGADQSLCTTATLLAAAPIPGNFAVAEGTWSIQGGTASLAPADIHDPAAPLTDIGEETVVLRWTVTNGSCGTAFDEVLVSRDTVEPEAICRTFNVYMVASGMLAIPGNVLGDDSEDNCYVDHFAPDTLFLTCSNLGPNDVLVTVFDGADNSSTCTAHVTLLDTLNVCDIDMDGFLPPDDCNNLDPTMYPGAPELCDGKDNDCDGTVPANESDNDDDGYRICEGDCDDSDAAINPGATEICMNNVDENCDGQLGLSDFVATVQPNCSLPNKDKVSISSVIGGTPPYLYSKDGGATFGTASVFSNLVPATYVFAVKDVLGCVVSQTIEIRPLMSLTTGVQNVLCNGGNTGAAAVEVAGGYPDFSYAWTKSGNPVGTNNDTISDLTSGTYKVIVTDNYGCTRSKTVTVMQPMALRVLGTRTNATCHGLPNGTIDLTVSGGTLPYSYLWDDGATTEDRSGIAAPDTLQCTVTDANGCVKISPSFRISQPSALILSVVKTNVLCYGDSTGTAKATALGGTGAKTYLWSNSETTALIDTLPAAVYTVTATDANLCTIVGTANVQQPSDTLEIESIASVQVGTKYTVTMTASGGWPTLRYRRTKFPVGVPPLQWVNSTTGVFTGVSAGTYTFRVQDLNGTGCIADSNATIPATLRPAQRGTNATAANLDFRLLPNPAQDFTSVVFDGEIPLEGVLEFYDVAARLVKTLRVEALAANGYRIDLQDFAPGIWAVTLRAPDAAPTTRRLIVIE